MAGAEAWSRAAGSSAQRGHSGKGRTMIWGCHTVFESLGSSGGGSSHSHPPPLPPRPRADSCPQALSITFLNINTKFMINSCSCDQGSPKIRKRWGEVTKEGHRGRWLQARESNQSFLARLWHWQSLMLCTFNY